MNTTDVIKQHYTGENGIAYFNQRKSKTAKAQAESAKIFQPYVNSRETVLDFGCGTGGIISNLKCSRRMGVEISEEAIKHALANGVEVFRNISEVPDQSVDVVITHHAIEHLSDPFETLVTLSKKLKPGGRIIVVVPADNPHSKMNRRWLPNIPKHLFSWNPLTLGNLLEEAGFQMDKSFILSGGYSHYIEWARSIPFLFKGLKILVAYGLGRFHTVCIAHVK